MKPYHSSLIDLIENRLGIPELRFFLKRLKGLYGWWLLLDSGVLCFDIARGSQIILKALEK